MHLNLNDNLLLLLARVQTYFFSPVYQMVMKGGNVVSSFVNDLKRLQRVLLAQPNTLTSSYFESIVRLAFKISRQDFSDYQSSIADRLVLSAPPMLQRRAIASFVNLCVYHRVQPADLKLYEKIWGISAPLAPSANLSASNECERICIQEKNGCRLGCTISRVPFQASFIGGSWQHAVSVLSWNVVLHLRNQENPLNRIIVPSQDAARVLTLLSRAPNRNDQLPSLSSLIRIAQYLRSNELQWSQNRGKILLASQVTCTKPNPPSSTLSQRQKRTLKSKRRKGLSIDDVLGDSKSFGPWESIKMENGTVDFITPRGKHQVNKATKLLNSLLKNPFSWGSALPCHSSNQLLSTSCLAVICSQQESIAVSFRKNNRRLFWCPLSSRHSKFDVIAQQMLTIGSLVTPLTNLRRQSRVLLRPPTIGYSTSATFQARFTSLLSRAGVQLMWKPRMGLPPLKESTFVRLLPQFLYVSRYLEVLAELGPFSTFLEELKRCADLLSKDLNRIHSLSTDKSSSSVSSPFVVLSPEAAKSISKLLLFHGSLFGLKQSATALDDIFRVLRSLTVYVVVPKQYTPHQVLQGIYDPTFHIQLAAMLSVLQKPQTQIFDWLQLLTCRAARRIRIGYAQTDVSIFFPHSTEYAFDVWQLDLVSVLQRGTMKSIMCLPMSREHDLSVQVVTKGLRPPSRADDVVQKIMGEPTQARDSSGIVVYYKPRGMTTNLSASKTSLSEHVANISLKSQCSSVPADGEGAIRSDEDSTYLSVFAECGVINRIDRNTSGIVLGSSTHLDLLVGRRASIVDRSISKSYRAIVIGCSTIANSDRSPQETGGAHWLEPRGTLCGLVGARRAPQISTVPEKKVTFMDSRLGTTRYRVLESFTVPNALTGKNRHYFLKFYHLDVNIDIGRTHQIRKQFAEIDFPILGDVLYHPHAAIPNILLRYTPKLATNKGFALHAFGVHVPFVRSSKALKSSGDGAASQSTMRSVIECGLPSDFEEILKLLRNLTDTARSQLESTSTAL